MAWNEPGGGNQKDPWGGGDKGPPDLDEALKKLQDKLNSIFGLKNSGKNGDSSGSSGVSLPGGGLLAVIAIGALMIYGALGFYQLDQQERAVVLRLGRFHEVVKPGLHWNWKFIDQVYPVNVTKVQSLSHKSIMLTEDENIVDVSISVQYRIADPEKYVLRVKSPEGSLEQATESALRHAVGGTAMGQIITEGREQIAVEVQQRLQQYLDAYQTGILIAKVNIENAHAPAQVQEAFDDVTRAKEDRERLKNEAETYANGIIPEARGRAQRQIEEANGYREQVVARAEGEAARFENLLTEYRKAPEVTRQRLYLETMQVVLGNTSKVMVDVSGSNNMLYLPLDKIVNSADRSSGVTVQEVPQLADPNQTLRRDTTRTRGEAR
ncbi:MAG: FtsH protease activity modulator HflK [Spongiibacteraceae bacterium]